MKPKRKKTELKAILPANDGLNHINIYSRGKTKLGKLLSNFANTPFCYNGELFQSVEGALYYYRTDDKRLISMHGNAAKKLGRSLKQVKTEPPELLKAWFLAKVYSNPEIIELLSENNLPFAHYYVMYGKVIEANQTLPVIWQAISNNLKKIKYINP